LLEAIMKVEVETPNEFQGSIIGDLSSRRGMINQTESSGPLTIIQALVPLAQMFGYATDVRSMSQGKATFTMEFDSYKRVPRNIQEEIIAAARELAAKKGK